MKHLLTITLLFCVFLANATIRRVNNNPGVVLVAGLVYDNFPNAFNESLSGDTIYIEPSVNFYSTVPSFDKKLTVIGDGYQKGSNNGLISPLSFSLNESILQGNFSIAPGAENSIFIGINFKNINVTVTANNIQLKRCVFSGSNAHCLVLNSSNNLVEQCYFSLEGGGHSDIGGNGNGNIFRNNIFTDIFNGQQNPIVDQCILGGVAGIVNGVFTNCIVGTNNYNVGTNNTFSNSIKINAPFGTPGNNNIENASVDDIFILGFNGNRNPFDASIDKDFRLKTGSIAIAAGTSGQDIGPFGGTQPYRLSGQPPVPIITNFFLSTTGSTSSGLTGSITIKSNN